jgi:hypothetical protein
MGDLRKICSDLSKTHHLRVFPKSAGPGPKAATGGGGDGLGCQLVPPLLAVNCSSFDLFFLIISNLGIFIDVSFSS